MGNGKTRTMILIKGGRVLNLAEIPLRHDADEYKKSKAREGLFALEVPAPDVEAFYSQVDKNNVEDNPQDDVNDIKAFENTLLAIAGLCGDKLTPAQTCRSLRQVADEIENVDKN